MTKAAAGFYSAARRVHDAVTTAERAFGPSAGPHGSGYDADAENFVRILFERAEAATDPLERASHEDHAYARERMIDAAAGRPWRRL